MSGFGEDLRSERERRGVSLETLCAQTKINQRHLESLEQGDYNALPGGVFRRGIVRAYCSSLGLEEQVWFARFQADYAEYLRSIGEEPETTPDSWASFAENVKKSRPTPKNSYGLRWFGVLALFLTLLAIALGLWHFLLRSHLRSEVNLKAGPCQVEGSTKTAFGSERHERHCNQLS